MNECGDNAASCSWRSDDSALGSGSTARSSELLHDQSLSEHGGASGLRDEGLLESALARPLNLAPYGSPDVADLAAAYGVGLAKNHPFVDGNKRAAFLAVGLFLALNGRRLVASQADATSDHARRRRRPDGRSHLRALAARSQRPSLRPRMRRRSATARVVVRAQH